MLVVLSPQEGESLVPCGLQCVCEEEEHAFLKINPEHTAVLVLSSRLAKDVEDYQVQGGDKSTENAWWCFKRRFPFEHFDERVEQGTCMLGALRQKLWPQS